jgi:ParB family chromosome partitioning protein
MTAREPTPRLGRGLAALLGDAATPPTADGPGVRALSLDLLDPSPYQPRRAIDPASLDELAASIRVRGVLQPLLARPHPDKPARYQIIAGERRWRAAQRAGLHEVPVLVRPLSDMEAMAAALVENLQRQDLNPIEEAEGYRRLLDEFALSQEALGNAVGKSRSHIANTLRLLNLPPRVQAEVRAGGLTAGHARALLAHPDPERTALQVIARGLNVRQTEALASRHDDPSRTAPDRTLHKDPDLRTIEQSLSAQRGLRVEIAPRGAGGVVHIRYRSSDQLDGLLSLLSVER